MYRCISIHLFTCIACTGLLLRFGTSHHHFFLGGDLVWEIQLDVLGMAARQAGLHRNVVWVLHILPLHDPPLRGCALADRKGNCTICVVIQ